MPPISTAQFVSSPCCLPKLTLEDSLAAYAKLGFAKFEAFSTWCTSRLDIAQDPAPYIALARRHGMTFTSFHLPPITSDFDATLAQALRGARFAQALGVSVMLYKADTRENYIRGAKPFLDTLAKEKITVTPVLQNHNGTAITTLDDFRQVLAGIHDPRMKTLLEVGHFQRAGIHWKQGYELLAGSIALVHINDIDPANNSVPFGTGLVDFPGLFDQLTRDAYPGNIVVELELSTHETDPARTLRCLGESITYLKQFCQEQP